MIPKAAIEKAIEGGYLDVYARPREVYDSIPEERHVFNNLFWQALGKALGWNRTGIKVGKFYSDQYTKEVVVVSKAQTFFRLILTGGDTEKFWNETLK